MNILPVVDALASDIVQNKNDLTDSIYENLASELEGIESNEVSTDKGVLNSFDTKTYIEVMKFSGEISNSIALLKSYNSMLEKLEEKL